MAATYDIAIPEIVEVPIANGGDKDIITDCSMDVFVFKSDSKNGTNCMLSDNYSASSRIIDGELYTRIDSEINNVKSTLIQTPDKVIVYDGITRSVMNETSLPDKVKMENIPELATLFPNANVDPIIEKLSKDGKNIIESKDNKYVIVEEAYPINRNDLDSTDIRLLKDKTFYDKATGVPVKEIYIESDSDGTIITTEIETVYQMYNDLPIVIALIEKIYYDFDYSIDVSDRMIPQFSADDTITISEDEYQEMVDEGVQFYYFNPVLGDPSNPDRTVTMTTLYKNIQLNSLSDKTFLK